MSARAVTILALSVLTLSALSLSRVVSAGEKHVVTQKGKSFSVTELHVKVGDVVEFKNDDDVSHNVFSVSKVQPFNTKMQTPGSEAAKMLNLSKATIRTHLEHIYRKLEVTNRVEAVTEGIRKGLISV